LNTPPRARMHIGHVALRSPNPELTATHLVQTLGLTQTARSNTEILLSTRGGHHDVQLITSGACGLDHLGLQVESQQDFDTLHHALTASDVEILAEGIEEPGFDRAMRFAAPGGVMCEVYTEHTPIEADVEAPRDGARKLGHVTLFSTEATELVRFFTDVLGFRESDRFGGRVTWLRCDADHHGIAVSGAAHDRLHHYAFELQDFSAIGRYCDRLSRLGKRLIWGPGRHGPGANLFTYTPDPDGAIVEAYADMQRIDNEAVHRLGDWDQVDGALNLWGPPSPANFGELGVPSRGRASQSA
jgi:catechol 2,3-dioxygenase